MKNLLIPRIRELKPLSGCELRVFKRACVFDVSSVGLHAVSTYK